MNISTSIKTPPRILSLFALFRKSCSKYDRAAADMGCCIALLAEKNKVGDVPSVIITLVDSLFRSRRSALGREYGFE